jgi:phosphopentomutase
LIKDHALLKYASALADVDAQMASLLTADKLADIVQLIPDSWLPDDPGFAGTHAQREAYLNFFVRRMQSSDVFVQEAIRARSSHL